MTRNTRTGARLRKLRMAKGVTARHVAGKLGVKASMLCHLEKGRRAWTDRMVEKYERLFR